MTHPRVFDSVDLPMLATMRRLGGSAAGGHGGSLEAAVTERGPRITPAETFEGREGYDKGFLGEFVVPIPRPTNARADDVLTLPDGSQAVHYQHFSVVMSASRRLAMFTAVNIDGKRSVKITRTRDRWSYDGRVPVEFQLGEELYEDNDLDRGHLVRREDPNWGDAATANAANDDTFHFTNCSPQMKGMNQKTWLGLETYILKNARAWKELVCVFTGPVFGAHDLTYRGVSIPLAYWKVIAFLSDEGRPSATAYMVDQEKELSTLEAAFGRYKTYQRSIRYIESISGLSFGRLSAFDGFSNEERRNRNGRHTRVESVLESLDDVRV